MSRYLIFSSLLVLLCSAGSSVDSVSISISAPPTSASISPSHFSFSIEQDRWLSWTGTGSRNDFAYNAFNNLKQLTGEPPWIRIGADSEDRTNFNPAIQVLYSSFPISNEISLKVDFTVCGRYIPSINLNIPVPRSINYHSWRWVLPGCCQSPTG
jgi:hypothetical protein